MRHTKMIALVIAMLGAVGSFVMIQNLANSRPSEAIIANTAPYMPEAIPQTPILLARQDIKMGKKIGPEDLEWVDWPEHLLTSPNFISKNANPNAIQDITQGSIAKHGFVAGEPITKNKIVKMGDKSMMASLLNKGMVAISVAVNEKTGVSGFISPGDRVDVMLTRPYRPDFGKHIKDKAIAKLQDMQNHPELTGSVVVPLNTTEVLPAGSPVVPTGTTEVLPVTSGNIKTAQPLTAPATQPAPLSMPVIAVGDGFYTETIIRNVRVLAIDQTVDNSNSKEPAKVVNTVTFEVPADQAELLSLAVRVGEINLSLRGLAENSDLGGTADSLSSVTGVLGQNFEDQITNGANSTAGTVTVTRDLYNSNARTTVPQESDFAKFMKTPVKSSIGIVPNATPTIPSAVAPQPVTTPVN